MNATPRVALALALAAAPACDLEADDAEKAVELQDARAGWIAANGVLASAHDRFVSRVGIEQFGEIDLDCVDGGTLHLVGRMSEQRDFQLDAWFDECAENGAVLDGPITVTASLDLFFDQASAGAYDHDDIRALVIVDYHGMLQLGGTTAGSCFIEAQVHATALTFIGFASDSVVVDGEVCGLDARSVIQGTT